MTTDTQGRRDSQPPNHYPNSNPLPQHPTPTTTLALNSQPPIHRHMQTTRCASGLTTSMVFFTFVREVSLCKIFCRQTSDTLSYHVNLTHCWHSGANIDPIVKSCARSRVIVSLMIDIKKTFLGIDSATVMHILELHHLCSLPPIYSAETVSPTKTNSYNLLAWHKSLFCCGITGEAAKLAQYTCFQFGPIMQIEAVS